MVFEGAKSAGRKFVVANWKMNPQTYGQADRLARSVAAYGDARVILCPPFPWLTDFSHKRFGVAWGAQDVFYENSGAYTGEVSAKMLLSSGVRYVIVGHSERRELGDTDAIVAKKLRAVLETGLSPIVCVGEKQRTKDKELRTEKEFVRKQLQAAFQGAFHNGALPRLSTRQSDYGPRVIIAYEPVWAISSRSGGRSDTPDGAAEMIRFIRDALAKLLEGSLLRLGRRAKFSVLYGGSVDGNNAAGFLGRPEVDGVLVGGASLKSKEFQKIVAAAREY